MKSRSKRGLVILTSLLGSMAVVAGIWAMRGGEPAKPKDVAAGELWSYAITFEVAPIPGNPDEPKGVIRGWYEAPFNTRWELGPDSDPKEGQTAIVVVTQTDFWFYDPDEKTYRHQTKGPEENLESKPFPLVSNLRVASILPPGFVSDEILAQFPRERILGREVAVIGDRTQGRAPRDLERFTTIWVDLEFRIVLREMTNVRGGSYDARAIELKLNQDVDDDVFRFEAPKGARAAPTRGPDSARPFPTAPPSRFLSPFYVPSGMGIIQSQGSGNSERWQTESLYSNGVDEMTLKQELAASDSLLLLGTPVPIGSWEGTHSIRGDEIVISWKQNDIKLTLSSPTLSLDELLRVAQSIRAEGQPQ